MGPGTPGLPHPRGPQHLPGWRDFRASGVGQDGWLWSRDRDLWVTGSEGRVNRGLHARAKGNAQKKARNGDWPGPGSGGQGTAAPQMAGAGGTLRREGGRGKPSARVAPQKCLLRALGQGPGTSSLHPSYASLHPDAVPWRTTWPPCPLSSFVYTPPQLLSLRSLEGMEGRDRGRRTYRGATLRLLDKAKAVLYLERPSEVFSAHSETTKVLFCF